MKNIVLVGLMGAGKTSVGKKLAEILGFDFIDTDSFIEKQENLTVSEIFSMFGEEKFRQLESDTILRICSINDTIIATGGGTVQNIENLNKLKENAFVVYLKASANILYERVKLDKNRPLLQNNNPLSVLNKLLTAREINYNRADYILNTDIKLINEITDEIIKVYNENC